MRISGLTFQKAQREIEKALDFFEKENKKSVTLLRHLNNLKWIRDLLEEAAFAVRNLHSLGRTNAPRNW